MRIDERLKRLEANAPIAPDNKADEAFQVIAGELDEYAAAKASMADSFHRDSGRAGYDFDPNGSSPLAEFGRAAGCPLPSLQIQAREPSNAHQ